MTKFSAAAENQREAARKRKVRAAGKVVQVRRLTREQKKRRKELEADDEAWLRYFFPELFWYEFTKQQKKMIAGIRRAITRGGDQAIAASRGEGKTTLAEMLALKHVLTGAVAFVLLLHSTGGKAQDSLAEIKEAIDSLSPEQH